MEAGQAREVSAEKKIDEVSAERSKKKLTRRLQKLFEKRMKEWNKSRKAVKLHSLIHPNKSGKKFFFFFQGIAHYKVLRPLLGKELKKVLKNLKEDRYLKVKRVIKKTNIDGH